MEDLLITPRELVQAMYDPETERADVEGVRQVLRQERLVEVPLALSAKRKREVRISVYCRVLWVVIGVVVPLSIAKEIWPDLWLTWMIVAMAWFAVVLSMVAFLFAFVKDEEKRNADVWSLGKDRA